MSFRSLCSATLLVAALSGPFAEVHADDRPTLTIVNWAWFMALDDDADPRLALAERSPLLRGFMKQHHCNIRYIEMDSELEIVNYLVENIGKVDVVNLPPDNIQRLRSQGLVMKIDAADVPERANCLPTVRRLIDDNAWEYQVPYHLGLMGLLYRKDVHKDPILDWSVYFDSASGTKLGALSDGPTMFVASLIHEKCTPLDPSKADLRKAGEALKRLKQDGRLRIVTSDLERVNEALLSGEITMAPMYSGDGLGFVASDASGRLAFTIPSHGTEVYVDSWMIPTNAPRVDLARAFVRFMLQSEQQVESSHYLKVQVCTKSALTLFKKRYPKLARDRDIVVPADVLDRCQRSRIHDVAPLQRLWKRILESE